MFLKTFVEYLYVSIIFTDNAFGAFAYNLIEI